MTFIKKQTLDVLIERLLFYESHPCEGTLASRKWLNRRKMLNTHPFRHSEHSEEPLFEGLHDDEQRSFTLFRMTKGKLSCLKNTVFEWKSVVFHFLDAYVPTQG